MHLLRRLALWAVLLALPLTAPVAAPPGAGPTKGAPAAAQGARLAVTASPRELRLAEGGRVSIRIASLELPAVSASIGRIERLRESASGVYEAEYVPPETLDPQVVLITAATPTAFGWTRVVLAGLRELDIRAPHRTPVSVNVAGKVFGPVPADGTGNATLRVDVPPGARVATYGSRKLDLDVPARGFSHVVIVPGALDASARGVVRVRALAFTSGGEPVPRSSVKLEASEGALSAPVQVEPGVIQADWSVEPGPLRQAKVTAQVASRPPSIASATLDRVAGAPKSVVVDVDRTTVVAGEDDILNVTARVLDAAGNPTDVPAKLVVSIGAHAQRDAVIDWQETGRVHVGRVLVPRERSGQQHLELKVVAAGPLEGTRSVALVPGPPTRVSIQSEEELFADGQRRQLRVAIFDEHGNRADPGQPVLVTADRGTVGAPARRAIGLYDVEYRSSPALGEYRDLIRARIGPLEGQAQLHVRSRGGTVVIAPKGTYGLGKGGFSSAGAGAELGLWTRWLGESIGLVLETRYLTSSRTDQAPVPGRTVAIDTDLSFLGLDASLAWRRPLLRGMLWLGAGGGTVRTTSTVSAAGQQDLTATSWGPSAHASASWGLPLGPGSPFAELRLGWHGDLSTGPVRGSLESLTFGLGYRFDVL